jgi:CheY-like chemotaxis protein
MNKNGEIIIIEDDVDDRDLFTMAFADLGYRNKLLFFKDGPEALGYLEKDDIYPFLILSDINLPKLDGFELKKMVQTNERLNRKCIPYLFFSTAVGERAVYDAYTMSVQGFFLKPSNFEALKETSKAIVEYWQQCFSPNFYDQENQQA